MKAWLGAGKTPGLKEMIAQGLEETDKEDQLENGYEVNGLKTVYSKCQESDYRTQEGKCASVSRVLTVLKQSVNQSSVGINGSEIDTSRQTFEKSRLK